MKVMVNQGLPVFKISTRLTQLNLFDRLHVSYLFFVNLSYLFNLLDLNTSPKLALRNLLGCDV